MEPSRVTTGFYYTMVAMAILKLNLFQNSITIPVLSPSVTAISILYVHFK